MHATDLEKSLRQFLRSSGKQLNGMTAPDVLHLATEHWNLTHVEGLRPEQGDGLVAYFEVVSRGRGTLFEFGVNRILRMPPENETSFFEWAPGYKLRLSVAYKTTSEIFQLKAPTSVYACWNKEQVSSFVAEVTSSLQYQLVAHCPQHSSGINFSECPGPPREANHATKGLTWAIA